MADYSIALQGRQLPLATVDPLDQYKKIQELLLANRGQQARQAFAKDYAAGNEDRYMRSLGYIDPSLAQTERQRKESNMLGYLQEDRLKSQSETNAEIERLKLSQARIKDAALSSDERKYYDDAVSVANPESWPAIREHLLAKIPKLSLPVNSGLVPTEYVQGIAEFAKRSNMGGAQGLSEEQRKEQEEQRKSSVFANEQPVKQLAGFEANKELSAYTSQDKNSKYETIPTKVLQNVKSYVDDYNKFKDVGIESEAGYQDLLRNLSGNVTGEKAVAVIYKFAKSLDPTGVVRESDYSAIAERAASMVDNLANKVKALGQGFTLGEDVVRDIKQVALSANQAMHSVVKAKWQQVANQVNYIDKKIDPVRLLGSQEDSIPSSGEKSNTNPVSVSTDPNAVTFTRGQ